MRFRHACFLLPALALGALLLAAGPGSAPGRSRTLGIDVSRFDGTIRWSPVAGSGVEFAFVEASRGDGDDCTVKPRRCGADPQYERNYEGARSEGIPVGAYHRAFTGGSLRADVREDARTEADLFVGQVGELRDGDLLPVLDVETPFGGLTPGELRLWLRTWLERVRKELGAKPIIYTNLSSWRATGNTREFARAGHVLWVAHWRVSRPRAPAGNWSGRGWSVWQFTNGGRAKGIDGRVDKDRLRAGFGKIRVG